MIRSGLSTLSKFISTLALSAILFVSAGQSVSAQLAGKTGERVICLDGDAGGFSCEEADLMSVLIPEDIGATMTCRSGNAPMRRCQLNDLWGWTDPQTGDEYALVGREDGTAFVNITDPLNPVFVGQLFHNGSKPSVWRDIKTYQDYAYIVSDGTSGNGIQIFDLTRLTEFEVEPPVFEATAVYTGFTSAHNIVINEETGYAYVVGARGATSCGGGLHMVSLENPTNPQFAGCFAAEGTGRIGSGYTHDAQCVVYHGPDVRYQGREICVGANETHVNIADVTDKSAPTSIASATYPNSEYIHQGWLTEDHTFFIQNDELDEARGQTPHTRTLIWDIAQLDDPVLVKEYLSAELSIDHNLYVKGDFVYQSNYIDGLRILDISDILNPVEVAHFDTHPADLSRWDGTWSNYPFFDSGVIAVSSSVDGLFIIQPTAAGTFVDIVSADVPTEFVVTEAYPNPFTERLTISLAIPKTQQLSVSVYDLLGRELKTIFKGVVAAGSEQHFDADLRDLPVGQYFYRVVGVNISVSKPITRVRNR